jgi:carbon monoxide dehydrogenase subunit G
VIEERPDGVIEGAIAMRLGPTVATFRGLVTPEFDDQARTGKLVGQGADKLGRSQAAATIGFDVTPGDGSATQFAIRGDIDLIGPLSSFLATGGAHVAQQMLKDFAAAVSARLGRRGAGPGGQSHAPRGFGCDHPDQRHRMLRLALAGWVRSTFRKLTRRGTAAGH